MIDNVGTPPELNYHRNDDGPVNKSFAYPRSIPANTHQRNYWNKVTAIIVVILILTVGGVTTLILANAASNKTDSGVTACKSIGHSKASDDSDNAPMTVAERDKALKPFQDSKYTDIKTAGVNLVTTLYQMDQASQVDSDNTADLTGAVGGYLAVTTYYAQLQTACANHGVTIPPLGK